MIVNLRALAAFLRDVCHPCRVVDRVVDRMTYDHECGCGVRWRGDDPCWNCEGAA